MDLENRIRARLGLPLRLDPNVRHDFPTAAVMVVRRFVDESSLFEEPIPDFLAVARLNGMIGLPGGKVAWHETPLEAALRETTEETGIVVPLHAVHHLGCWLDGSEKKLPTFAFYCTLPAREKPIDHPRQTEEKHPLSWALEAALCDRHKAECFAYNRKAITALWRYRWRTDAGFGQGFDVKLWRDYRLRQIGGEGSGDE